MKKTCATCKEEKQLNEFRKDRTRNDKHQSYCKICARSYHASKYQTTYGPRYKDRNSKRYYVNSKRIDAYKTNGCTLCDEKDLSCLDFHHTDPTVKEINISKAKHYTWSRIEVELERCIVLCSNCHRKVHAGKIHI